MEKVETDQINSSELLQRIYGGTIRLLAPLTLEKACETIVKEAMNLTGAKHGTFHLVTNDGLKRMYATSPVFFDIVPREGGNISNVVKKKGDFIFSAHKAETLHPQLKKLKIGSNLSMAIYHEGKTLGVLSVLSKRKVRFGKRELKILNYFRPIASLILYKTMMLEEQRKMVEDRDMFISLAAHELKTPLTTIYAYSQLMAKYQRSNRPIRPEYIEGITRSALRLNDLIEELLQTTRIQKGSLGYEMETIDLLPLVDRVVKESRHHFGHNRFSYRNLVKKNELMIEGDEPKLRQVLMNVLNNAGKFSPKEKVVLVELINNDDDYEIIVQDEGIGISKKSLKNIFDPFNRGENNVPERGGLGLGLHVAKEIIDRHGGKILVESKEGKGTKVIISLKQLR